MNQNQKMTIAVLGLIGIAFGYLYMKNRNSSSSTDSTGSAEAASAEANYTLPADVGSSQTAPTYSLPAGSAINYGQSLPLPMQGTYPMQPTGT